MLVLLFLTLYFSCRYSDLLFKWWKRLQKILRTPLVAPLPSTWIHPCIKMSFSKHLTHINSFNSSLSSLMLFFFVELWLWVIIRKLCNQSCRSAKVSVRLWNSRRLSFGRIDNTKQPTGGIFWSKYINFESDNSYVTCRCVCIVAELSSGHATFSFEIKVLVLWQLH